MKLMPELQQPAHAGSQYLLCTHTQIVVTDLTLPAGAF